MAKLEVGDRFPEMQLDSRDGEINLAERWQQTPLIVAFMRHFG
jgi:hypothetical protein